MLYDETRYQHLDWLSSLQLSPGTQAHLIQKTMKKQLLLLTWASHSAFDPDAIPCIEPLPQDRRFRDPVWRYFPTICFIKTFCFNSSGGITPQQDSVAYPHIMSRQ